jgi:hypothetical protein
MRRLVLSALVLGLVLVPTLAEAGGGSSSAEITAIPIEAAPDGSGWVIHDVEGVVACPVGQSYTGTVKVKSLDGAPLYSAKVSGRCRSQGSVWRIVRQTVSDPACPTEALAGGQIKLSTGSRFEIARSQWAFPSCS